MSDSVKISVDLIGTERVDRADVVNVLSVGKRPMLDIMSLSEDVEVPGLFKMLVDT